MEATVEQTGTFDRNLTVRIKAERVNQLLDQELAKLAGQVKLPGFRPGKIPKSFLEARFKDHLTQTITENLLRESYPKALQEHSLRPVNEPVLKINQLLRDQDFVYVATMQIIPKVEPKGYQGIPLTRFETQVTDSDVDAAMQKIQQQHASFEANAEHKAGLGDKVVLNFKGFVNDEPFEGGTEEGHLLELGSGRFIAGFEEQLIGSQAGEKREVRVTFPTPYPAAHLAGKEALFFCTITEVQRRIVPPVDDELATLSNIQEGGLEKLREQLAINLEAKVKAIIYKHLRQQIATHLLEANPMELPDQLVAIEQNAMVEQTRQAYQNQGLDLAQLGLNEQRLALSYQETASQRVRFMLLINAIARQENLQATDAMVTERINLVSESYGPKAKEFQQWVRKNEAQWNEFRSQVLEDLTISWLTQNGSITQTPCSLEELLRKNSEK